MQKAEILLSLLDQRVKEESIVVFDKQHNFRRHASEKDERKYSSSKNACCPKRVRSRNGWRAGYIERCTSGSEGGSVKPVLATDQGARFLPYKTTTTRNLLQFLHANLARMKAPMQSVVGLDSDGQSHLSKSFRVNAAGRKHMYHVFKERDLYVEEVLLKHPGGEIYLAPTTDDLYGIDTELAPVIKIKDATQESLQAITNVVDDLYWYEVLREKISRLLGHVAYIVIDCPPALGALTINALAAATGAVIPSQTEFLSYDGLGMIHKTISLVKGAYNPDLEVVGIVPTLYDARVGNNRDILDAMRTYYKESLIDIPIPRWAAFSDSIPKGMAVGEYSPDPTAVKIMQQVTVELMRRDILQQIKQHEQVAA